MNLPEYEWVRFRKSPLRQVIAQMRFTIMPRFEKDGFIADFQEAIRDDYPKLHREPIVTYQLTSTGVSSGTGDTAWRLSSKDLHWAVIVSEAALTLETRSYYAMNDFVERFQRLLEAAQEKLGVADRLRLGLRYVNEIRYPGAKTLQDWQELLNPELVGVDAANLLAGEINHTLQEIQVKRPDGTFAIRHGLLKGTVVPPLPNEPSVGGRFYLVDLDYYDTDEYDLDIPDVVSKMWDYNDVMTRFFRWALSEKLYTYLEPDNAS